MALDYLPIQASSVPCEWALSSSTETDMSHRNWISPILMEALQMLKYSINNEPMDFTSDLLIPEAELHEDTTQDLLAKFSKNFAMTKAHEDMLDQVIRAVISM